MTHKTKIQVDEKYKVSRFLQWSEPKKWAYKGTVAVHDDKWEVDYYSIYTHKHFVVLNYFKKFLLPSCSDQEQQESLVVMENAEILTRSEFEESFQSSESMCIGI